MDREHNSFGARLLEAEPLRESYERQRMARDAVSLDGNARSVAPIAIQDVCRHEGWTLYAAHVRSTHVHVVVEAEPSPEEVMGKLKAYASRALNRRSGRISQRWSRHGSTRHLWSPAEVDGAVDYVVYRQGEAMAMYQKPDRWSLVT